MMVSLDVHVLSLPERRGAQMDACLASVELASSRAGYPVEIHVIEVEPDHHIGRARAEGYSRGTGRYVTNVDDDDTVAPDAFAALRTLMQEQLAAIYTGFMQHEDGESVERIDPAKDRVLLRVLRRDVAEAWDGEAWPAHDRPAIVAHADAFGPYGYIRRPLYNYNVSRDSAASRAARANREVATMAAAAEEAISA